MTEDEFEALAALSRSRTEPASRVSRAQILLAYRDNPSFCAVGRRLGVHTRLSNAASSGRWPTGRWQPSMIGRGRARNPRSRRRPRPWLASLACDKAKDHGYPHELWTTRLLARHAREHGPAAGHKCLANLVQGTVCKILGKEEIKPHKVRSYLENRDAEFE